MWHTTTNNVISKIEVWQNLNLIIYLSNIQLRRLFNKTIFSLVRAHFLNSLLLPIFLFLHNFECNLSWIHMSVLFWLVKSTYDVPLWEQLMIWYHIKQFMFSYWNWYKMTVRSKIYKIFLCTVGVWNRSIWC